MNLYPPGATFCRTCGYCLHGLPTPRCPECGQAFDPADPATFLSRPRRRWIKRTIFWTVFALLVVGVAYGGFLTWLYLGWKAEEPARALVEPQLYYIETRSLLPPALSCLLVGECREWPQRVDTVRIRNNGRPLKGGEIAATAACRKLRVLSIGDARLNGDDVAALCRCRELRELRLCLVHLRGEDVLPVADLVHLEMLSLFYDLELDDAALTAVGKLKQLRELNLGRTAVTDAGLDELAGLPKLEKLSLYDCPNLTDAAVPRLSRLTRLKKLSLWAPRMSAAGIDALRAALPGCDFEE